MRILPKRKKEIEGYNDSRRKEIFTAQKDRLKKSVFERYRFQYLTGRFDKFSYTVIKFRLAQRFCKNHTDKLSAAGKEQISFDS